MQASSIHRVHMDHIDYTVHLWSVIIKIHNNRLKMDDNPKIIISEKKTL